MTATVLVVDDVEANVKLLEAKLFREYYVVLTASSGIQALEILKNHRVDVILLDVMMPEMDGFDTCRKIKTNPDTAHIPVVMVTALSYTEDRVKGLEAGADEFLSKPIDDVALFARVKSLSRMKSIIDELKMRNKTNEELGGDIIEFNIDEFSDSKILLIDDDLIQARNVKAYINSLTKNVKMVKLLEDINGYLPDVIIISAQLINEDPLRVVVMLKNKEQFKNSAFMMLTEEENASTVIKGIELGVNDYFSYPVDKNELVARVKTQLRRKKYQDSLRSEFEETVDLSIKDGLTGVFNRRYFDLHMTQMVERAKDNKSLFCMMMIDIDYFKKVNDTYGHLSGDEVIKYLMAILKNSFRVTDLIARYGGEEFVVVLRDSDIEEANSIAERIRKSVEDTDFIIPAINTPIKQTISIGLAEYKLGESLLEFVSRADQALYSAKASGRNRVAVV